MDRLNQLFICDEILRKLNFKANPEHTYLYTASFTGEFGHGPTDRALKQLLKDGYIYEGKDANKDPARPPNYSYTITPIGQYFIETEGYEEKARKDKLRDQFSIDLPRSILLSNRLSRTLSLVTVALSLVTVVITIANFLKKDDNDHLYQQLIQLQKQIDSITRPTATVPAPTSQSAIISKKDSTKTK